MDNFGFVLIEFVGVIVQLLILIVTIAMFGWFGWAVGGAIGENFKAEDSGGFLGMLVGIASCVALLFLM